jgi:hypothetical protein
MPLSEYRDEAILGDQSARKPLTRGLGRPEFVPIEVVENINRSAWPEVQPDHWCGLRNGRNDLWDEYDRRDAGSRPSCHRVMLSGKQE